MRINIRSKLMIAITLLVAVLFSVVAFLFINEKKVEIADDIYLNALAFSKLTAEDVVDDYELYLVESGFVYFNREIQDLFEKNDDVSSVAIATYSGELVYDSNLDLDKKYVGEARIVSDELLSSLKSEHLSVRTVDGRVAYLKNGEFVDLFENPIEDLEKGVLVDYLVVPASEKFSVVYRLDYHNLFERVSAMELRIMYVALFGILLGILMASFMSRQITLPVRKLVKGAKGISSGDFKTRVDIRTHDELSYLGSKFNEMAEDLEKSMEAKLYKERVTHELELAAEIQDQLIPDDDEIPNVEGIDISVDLVPAEEIGGDLYDFTLTKDKFMTYLGDVTGHGVPAGIVSSIASALFYGYRELPDLTDILVKVNNVLKVKTMTNMFMTLCLLEWDIVQKKLKYVSAGHEQIVHFCARDNKAVLLPAGGVALGMLPDISKSLRAVDVDFQPGDFVITYSDGIPEAWKNEKENYGMERLLNACTIAGALGSAAEIKKAILDDVNSFRSGYKQQDDITLIVLRRPN